MQRSFDDLGTPLCDVTFVVVDLETTGGSPAECAITEVGAVKLRAGECLGTFATLVNPGLPIPVAVTFLTGITESMVLPAPSIDQVLPMLLEFIGDAVVVGHNVRFDLSFLGAALARAGRPELTNRSVDTCALARRLVREEVPNCKLATLAAHFRVPTVPIHRALDDARATGEVLHCLLERAGSLGVLALDDLLALPSVQGHPQLAKLRLAAKIPRKPGVYLFRDAIGGVLYVGRATDLRRRVRSYFSGDERRKVGQLLREVAAIDHIVCSGPLEAAVVEVRLIQQLAPRFNRQVKAWRRYAYLKLTLDERFPRLSVVRTVTASGALYLGPVGSSRTARLLADALEGAVPIRRCTRRPNPRAPVGPCTPAQLGVSTCPCSGAIDETAYAQIVARLVHGLTVDPAVLIDPLRGRMLALAGARRYEEAAVVRDQVDALGRAIARQRRLDAVRRAGRLTVEVPGEGGATIEDGRLVNAWASAAPRPDADLGAPHPRPSPLEPPLEPLSKHLVDEINCVAAWLHDRAGRLRLLECERGRGAPPPPPPPHHTPGGRPAPLVVWGGPPPPPLPSLLTP